MAVVVAVVFPRPPLITRPSTPKPTVPLSHIPASISSNPSAFTHFMFSLTESQLVPYHRETKWDHGRFTQVAESGPQGGRINPPKGPTLTPTSSSPQWKDKEDAEVGSTPP